MLSISYSDKGVAFVISCSGGGELNSREHEKVSAIIANINPLSTELTVFLIDIGY